MDMSLDALQDCTFFWYIDHIDWVQPILIGVERREVSS